LRELLRSIDTIPQIRDVLTDDRLQTVRKSWSTVVFQTGVVLFHTGVIDQLPQRQVSQERLPLSTLPRVLAVMERYLAERALFDRPASLEQTRQAFRRLSNWLALDRPTVVSLAELKRVDLLDFLTWVQSQRKIKSPGEELSLGYRRIIAWQISAFFRYASHAEWDDVPVRAPLTASDVPRGTFAVPRYIPTHELEPLMEHIRQLQCPLQRCALLVARWSGARRTEIRNCTPRTSLPRNPPHQRRRDSRLDP
jgi:integrase